VRDAMPHLCKQQPAGMEAGCMNFSVFALQKPKTQKWHGGHF
jgi:hypothetical protein